MQSRSVGIGTPGGADAVDALRGLGQRGRLRADSDRPEGGHDAADFVVTMRRIGVVTIERRTHMGAIATLL